MKNVKLVDPIVKQSLRDLEERMKEYSIILYNDDVNTFDVVVSLLIFYCKQQPFQAEQCALIVHTKGKYPVKHGTYEELQPITEALAENGLTVEIE
jgi:ATP-dependent Clp protease adaptor protein ClpS